VCPAGVSGITGGWAARANARVRNNTSRVFIFGLDVAGRRFVVLIIAMAYYS
jgi:hypothetical protein